MTKKTLKILGITFVTFLALSLSNLAYAKEVESLDELGKEILYVNPNAEYAYIIGNYVFTSNHELTTQDVMLAARSIEVSKNAGKTNKDSIYGEMTINTIERIFDENAQPTGWKETTNLVGNSKWQVSKANKKDIQYIDYNYVKRNCIVTFEFNNGSAAKTTIVKENDKLQKPEKPTKKGYQFLGWYMNEQEYNFETKVVENITLTAKWALEVNVNTLVNEAVKKVNEINKGRYETTLNEGTKTATVKVKNVARDEKLVVGGTGILATLTEVLNHEKVQNITIAYENGKDLVLSKNDRDLYTKIVTWLSTYIEKELPQGTTIETATNEMFVGKSLSVKVVLTPDVKSENGNKEENYTLKIEAEEYMKVNIDSIVTEAITKVNSSKYNVILKEKEANVKVLKEARKSTILSGDSGIIVAVTNILQNEKINSITVACEGVGDLTIGKTLNLEEIKNWISNYSNIKLGGKNLIDITNEDFNGETFKLTIKTENGIVSTASGSKTETYKLKITLEPYQYTVNFDMGYDGAQQQAPITVAEGQKIPIPTEPQRKGYKLDGWYIGEEKYNFEKNIVTENVTLKAKWKNLIDIEEYINKNSVNKPSDDFEVKLDTNKTITYGVFIKVNSAGSVMASKKVNAVTQTNYAKDIYAILNSENIENISIEGIEFNLTTINTENDVKTKILELLANTAGKTTDTVTLKDLIGKTLTVKIKINKSKAVLNNSKDAEVVYTIIIKGKADIAAIQQASLNAINHQHDNYNGTFYSLGVSGGEVTVKVENSKQTIIQAIGGSGVKSAVVRFLTQGNGIKYIDIYSKEDDTNYARFNYEDAQRINILNSSNILQHVMKNTEEWKTLNRLTGIFPDCSPFGTVEPCMSEQAIIKITLEDNYYTDNNTTYKLVFIDGSK